MLREPTPARSINRCEFKRERLKKRLPTFSLTLTPVSDLIDLTRAVLHLQDRDPLSPLSIKQKESAFRF